MIKCKKHVNFSKEHMIFQHFIHDVTKIEEQLEQWTSSDSLSRRIITTIRGKLSSELKWKMWESSCVS
jgi:hypothetical protein